MVSQINPCKSVAFGMMLVTVWHFKGASPQVRVFGISFQQQMILILGGNPSRIGGNYRPLRVWSEGVSNRADRDAKNMARTNQNRHGTATFASYLSLSSSLRWFWVTDYFVSDCWYNIYLGYNDLLKYIAWIY